MRTDVRALLRGTRVAASLLAIAIVAGCGGGSGSGTSLQSGRVSGRVFAPPGRATRAPVTVSCDGTTVSTVAGADGRFTLEGVPAGLRTIYAHSDKGAIAIVARVDGGGETQVGDLELADAGQISGLVTSTVDGQVRPVHDARVTVSPVAPENADDMPFPVRTTRTNPQGSYTVDALPVGHYIVSVSAVGYSSASVVTDVAAGRTSSGDVTLVAAPKENPGSMTGVVTLRLEDGTTSPLSGALVRLAKSDYPELLRPMPGEAVNSANGKPVSFGQSRMHPYVRPEHYTFTDDQGRYKLDGVEPGEYVAVAARSGLAPDRKPVTIVADKALEQDFTLTLRRPRAGIVTGTVSDLASGQPIKGANVWVHFNSPPPYGLMDRGDYMTVSPVPATRKPLFMMDDMVLNATTDENGRYRVIAPDGAQVLSIYADGYLGKEVEVTVTAGGEVTADVKLEKDPGQVTIKGRTIAKSADGSVVPVAGASVWASPWGVVVPANSILPGPEVVYTAVSDERGEFTLTLHAGKYTVGAETERLAAPPQEVEIRADTTLEIVLEKRE